MSYRVGDTSVPDAEAWKVACPECDAKPDAPCVYTWPKAVSRDGQHNARVQALIDRVGTPAQKCHNGRRRAAHALRTPIKPKPERVNVRLNEEQLKAILAGDIWQGLRQDLEHALWRLTGAWVDTTPPIKPDEDPEGADS